MSFRLKTIIGLALIQAALAVILIVSGLNWMQATIEDDLRGRATHMAHMLATTTKDPVISEDLAALQSFINEALSDEDIVYVRIRAYDQILSEMGRTSALLRPFAMDSDIHGVDDGIFDTRAEIAAAGTHLGWVELGLSTQGLEQTLLAIRNKALGIGAVGLLLSVLLASTLGSLLSRQLGMLQDAARRLRKGEMGHHIEVTGRDEIAQTAQAFNAMSKRLAEFQAQQQLALQQTRQLARELQESESYTRAIIDNINDAIITTDQHGEIVTVNPGTERIFGFRADELLGRNIALLMPRGLAESHGQYIAAYNNRTTTLSPVMGRDRVLHAVRKDGSRLPVEVTVSPIETEGMKGYVGILRDITERMAMERALIDAKEAAELGAKAKATFLANMSHEIRTPMNGVLGMMELLDKTELDGRQRSHLQTARNSAGLLLNIINDILDFSKIDAGKLSLEYIEFDLRGCVDDVGQLLAARAAEKGLELHTQVDNRLPFRVKGDPTRFAQILNNLVGNAIKFTDEGEINVRVGLDQLWDDQLQLHVEVQDTGVGIPEEVQQRLFSPFTQADETTTRHFGGTGLGLSISKQLAALMGGDIGVRSQPGAGATFWFTAQMAVAGDRATPRLKGCRGRRMLIVDDNATNREVLEHYLDGWQVKHASARDATEALQLLSADESTFAAVLLDVQMPDMDGISLARRLAEDPRLGQLPMVILSSDGNGYDRQDAPNIVASLTKPVPYKRLHNVLSDILCVREEDGPEEPHSEAGGQPAPVGSAVPRVLLVDDNQINREVALGMLSHLGAEVIMAEDGEQAVASYRSGRFDMILMDCQMPVLNGYDATRQIRQLEAGSGRRTPIIALTANALQGDRQKSLDAGMDDHLVKPFDAADLQRALDTWVARQPAPTHEASPAMATENTFDHAKADDLIARMGKNFSRIVEHFRDNGAELLQAMRAAENAEQLAHAAHTLKGSSATLGASGLAEHCKALELAAKQGDTAQAARHIERIGTALAQAVAELEAKVAAAGD